MSTLYWMMGSFFGIVFIIVLVVTAIVLRSVAPVDLDIERAILLDEKQHEGHTYTLLDVTTGVTDKAHFVALYRDLAVTSEKEGDDVVYSVRLKDAHWYTYVESVRFAEIQPEQQIVTFMGDHAVREIFQISPSVFE